MRHFPEGSSGEGSPIHADDLEVLIGCKLYRGIWFIRLSLA